MINVRPVPTYARYLAINNTFGLLTGESRARWVDMRISYGLLLYGHKLALMTHVLEATDALVRPFVAAAQSHLEEP